LNGLEPKPLPDCHQNEVLDDLIDASYTVTVFAEDVLGNEDSDTHNFYVDTSSNGNPGGGFGGGAEPLFAPEN